MKPYFISQMEQAEFCGRGILRPSAIRCQLSTVLCWILLITVGGWLHAEGRFAGYNAGQSRSDNGIKMTLRWCPPGEFVMGSPADEPGRDPYEKQHRVRLTQGFWMGETEVTQEQWTAVTGKTLRHQAEQMLADEMLYPFNGKKITLREASKAADGSGNIASVSAAMAPNIPIYYVSWDDAMMFCAELTTKELKAGRLPAGCIYTLPTEAQWEYACRAGTTTATYAGAMKVLGENNAPVLNKIAWYGGNSSVGYKGAGWTTLGWPHQAFPGKLAGPRRVGQQEANAWGLKDMLGNLYEWVADFSSEYADGEVVDPLGPATGSGHPFRGGAWNHYATMCRAAKSFEAVSTYRVNYLGFRVAFVKK
ncbi:MAG: formylglycine-generating enzyme family protein [Verrucomicrobia bacterium]|nr:formylglycine-generating enzyme family protein [Verrucomicrobiota bacterium]